MEVQEIDAQEEEMCLTNGAQLHRPHGRMTDVQTYDRASASALIIIGIRESNTVVLTTVCAATEAERNVSLWEKLAGGGEDGGWRQWERARW